MTRIFAVRTTAGQEKNVALLIERRCISKKIAVKSIISPPDVSSYIFIEADGPNIVSLAIENIKHVKGWVVGKIELEDIMKFLIQKPVIESINVNDKVEIVSGPFRGMQAKVTRVDKSKGEIVVELLEAPYTLPITLRAEQVKIISKSEASKQEIKQETKKSDIFEEFSKLEE
ncbi:MAG: transcription elongation factor Spt5 [Candidatus Verstraetearchaeota archaeon]|jgi:transcriptional antiterminator NusG|nr:transcription elongation factor Spt5 [Candidatus Verstraetearchaeota archaeon]